MNNELIGVLEDNSLNVIVQIAETGPRGPQGEKGDDGRGIVSIVRTSGTGEAGTYDTYTISFTDGSTTTYQVYNGKDGTSFRVLGIYPTLEELQIAVPNPIIGDSYFVGAEAPYDVYTWTGSEWLNLGPLQGPEGRGILKIERTSGTGASGTTDIYTITLTDETTYTFQVYNGKDGAPGVRGSRWYAGTAITGTSTVPTAYATGITDAIDGDMYINTATSYVYKCTQGGDESTALWVYSHSQKGSEGGGAGDMTKAVYDADNDGVVDNAAKLGGLPPEDYAKKSDISSAINTHDGDSGAHSAQFDNKLDKSGGTMTGSLILAGDPTQALEAVTKQYVDELVGDIEVLLASI